MQRNVNIILLMVGLILIILPLGFIGVFPDQVDVSSFYLRLIAALGGALVGAIIPGLLDIQLPGIRAAGALAVLVLFWMFNPPQAPKKLFSLPNRYDYNGGYFEKDNKNWVEHINSTPVTPIFNELRRDKQYIFICDSSRTIGSDQKNIMNVRIPINGGMAYWSWTTPNQWKSLVNVTPVRVYTHESDLVQ